MLLDQISYSPNPSEPIGNVYAKVNAAIQVLNDELGAGLANQIIAKISGADFDYGFVNALYNTSSSSSVAVNNTSNKTFTVGANLAFVGGNRVRATSGSNYIEGDVVSYSGTTLVIQPDVIKGSGTLSSWTIGLATGVPYSGSLNLTSSNTTFFGFSSSPSISSADLTFFRMGHIIMASIRIVYSGGSGTGTSIDIDLTGTELLHASGFSGYMGGVHSSQSGANAFPVLVHSNKITIGVELGGSINSGSNTIIGTVFYPAKLA